MLLRLDDPMASVAYLAGAEGHDGRRLTITDREGLAYGRATLRALSADSVQLTEREVFAPADRYRIRSDMALEGRAVRSTQVELRPEQAAFRQRVGEAWGWRCAITGEDVPEVLEAAHLPGANWRTGDNEASYGIRCVPTCTACWMPACCASRRASCACRWAATAASTG